MLRFEKASSQIAGVCWMLLASLILAVPAVVMADDVKADDPADALTGAWVSRSIMFADGNGRVEQVRTGNETPCNAIITDKMLTLRAGPEIVSEMTYTIDPKASPRTIDIKSPEGPMLGIYEMRGNGLRISLNDEAKGRPKDVDPKNCGMAITLRRFYSETIFVMDADGGNLRPVATLPELTAQGSPDWSHNGKLLAIDAWRSIVGESYDNSHVFLVGVEKDGESLKDLGPGAMPSWSPDDKKIVFSQYAPERGVCIMNADGSGREMIDPAGWSAQWSPKRNEIAFTTNAGGSANICVYDVDKKERRMLLKKPYQQVLWGLAWSPDGQWVCFKGVNSEGRPEIAAVSVDGEEKGFKIALPGSASPEVDNASSTLSCGGPGSQALLSMKGVNDHQPQFYTIDFLNGATPQRLAGFPENWKACDPAWSPDGKEIAFSAVTFNQPAAKK